MQLPYSFVALTAADSSRTIQVWNSSTASMSWTAGKDAAWLSISSTSGTIDPEGQSSNITITCNPAGLSGKNIDTIRITGANQHKFIIVSFVAEGSPVSVTGVTVNPGTANIPVGQTLQLSAAIDPINANNTSVTWNSSNPAVATVSGDGIVTGIAEGKVTITVTTDDQGKTATCLVTILPAILPDEVASISAPLSVEQGSTPTITVNYSASTVRDLHVEFDLGVDPWTNYSKVILSVPAGTGTTDIPVKIADTVPVAANGYAWDAYIVPTGLDWNSRVGNEIWQGNVSVTAKQPNIVTTKVVNIVNVYPNPCISEVNISLPSDAVNAEITLMDMYGKIQKVINAANANFVSIPIDDVSPGVYFVKIQQGEANIVKKIIIVK